MAEVMLPFSDEFSDFDENGDKLITYKEFVSAVLRSVNMADPEELQEPFVFADFDGKYFVDFLGLSYWLTGKGYKNNKLCVTEIIDIHFEMFRTDTLNVFF